VGVVGPYPIEWDSGPYPPRFKALNLHTFNSKGSLNQHIYYFKSQTENIVSNETIMAHLFIDTLKGVAFEWFMKLPSSSIKKWVNLGSSSWRDSLKMTLKYPYQLSLLKSKRKESQSKRLWRDFRVWHFDV